MEWPGVGDCHLQKEESVRVVFGRREFIFAREVGWLVPALTSRNTGRTWLGDSPRGPNVENKLAGARQTSEARET